MLPLASFGDIFPQNLRVFVLELMNKKCFGWEFLLSMQFLLTILLDPYASGVFEMNPKLDSW